MRRKVQAHEEYLDRTVEGIHERQTKKACVVQTQTSLYKLIRRNTNDTPTLSTLFRIFSRNDMIASWKACFSQSTDQKKTTGGAFDANDDVDECEKMIRFGRESTLLPFSHGVDLCDFFKTVGFLYTQTPDDILRKELHDPTSITFALIERNGTDNKATIAAALTTRIAHTEVCGAPVYYVALVAAKASMRLPSGREARPSRVLIDVFFQYAMSQLAKVGDSFFVITQAVGYRYKRNKGQVIRMDAEDKKDAEYTERMAKARAFWSRHLKTEDEAATLMIKELSEIPHFLSEDTRPFGGRFEKTM